MENHSLRMGRGAWDWMRIRRGAVGVVILAAALYLGRGEEEQEATQMCIFASKFVVFWVHEHEARTRSLSLQCYNGSSGG